MRITSVAIFATRNAMCGSAPIMDVIIIGIVIERLGSVGMDLGNLNHISINTSRRERPVYLGKIGIICASSIPRIV